MAKLEQGVYAFVRVYQRSPPRLVSHLHTEATGYEPPSNTAFIECEVESIVER